MKMLENFLNKYYAAKLSQRIIREIEMREFLSNNNLCFKNIIGKRKTKILVKKEKWEDKYYKLLYCFNNEKALEILLHIESNEENYKIFMENFERYIGYELREDR